MNAVVVYESFWGNTAEVAKAIAEGIGPEARVLSTDEATDVVLAPANLIVAGAPILGFSLARDGMRHQISRDAKAPTPADLSRRSMREWLEAIPTGEARYAAFETGFRWSPGSAARKIGRALEEAGYIQLVKPERFVVRGSYGPLEEGELERARVWGVNLTVTMNRL
ncbi:MAG: flavodoxin family protein [Coriobacteriia bacterium]